MHLTLNYRPFVKKIFWYVLFGLVLSELVIIRWNYEALKDADWLTALFKILLASGVIISLFYRLLVYVRPRVFSRYEVFDQHVDIINGKKVKKMEFNQIQRIRFSWTSPRFFGGFTVYLKSGQKFVFSSILERSEQVLVRIDRSRPDLIDEGLFKKYMNFSEWTPHAWDRIRLRIQQVPMLIIKIFALPLVTAFAYSYRQTGALWGDESISFWWVLLGCFVLNLVITIGLNNLEESIVSRLFFKEKKRKQDVETKLFMLFTGIHFFVFMLLTYLVSVY
tara:strand:+ start:95126 stop:95959 length:834 start_codon:yes stop_codon:yes gene_type:complete